MEKIKILTNQNKIISKLPNNFEKKIQSYSKNCKGIIGNQVKLKLIEPIYLDVNPEDIVSTFLYLFNNNEGKGIFVNIYRDKIKNFIPFTNEAKGLLNTFDLNLINRLYKIFNKIIRGNTFNLLFFINIGNYPVLFKSTENKNKKMIPILSFTTSYSHYDICLPLPYSYTLSEKTPPNGILFLFEKRKIDKESDSLKIYKRILELKTHPHYKNFNLNYAIIDNCNERTIKKIDLLSTIIIISDPYVPIYYQYFLKSKSVIVLIENTSHYTYHSKLLKPDVEYISWTITTWEQQLDKYVENKKISGNLNKWVDEYLTEKNINLKYLGFLEHLHQNFYKSDILVEPFTNYTESNINITTQLDYDKFFDLLYTNYKLIRCWSYRLNPYSNLLSLLKTNHNFIPEYIKLSLTSFGTYENIHWFSGKRAHIDFLPQLLKKNGLKNINQYYIDKSEDLINFKIINNISSVFYIEIPEPSSKFNLWENEFLSDFESFMQFMHLQPEGSIFIFRIFTFHNPRTINMIQTFQSYFEKIKIIKNEWFDSYLPYRYLVGIRYTKNKNKDKSTHLDFETYNNLFFSVETQELIKVIKYIKSDAQVDITKFKSYELTNEWLYKWFNQMTNNFT
jgi:hypothetical protein